MKTGIIKRRILWTLSVFVFLCVVLAIHIYLVTKPRVDAQTRVMARIDIGQPIDTEEASHITSWLYHQKGVDHVMCNSKTALVIFTFSPLLANANIISKDFSKQLGYATAARFIPSAAQLEGSCPVASNSFTFKAYHYISYLF